MVASAFRGRVSTRWVYAMGALAGVLFGYDNGIIGAALLFMPRDLPLTPWQKGAVVSATVFGAMLGALGSGPAADRLGRQRLLLAAGVIFTVGALGAGAAATCGHVGGVPLCLGIGHRCRVGDGAAVRRYSLISPPRTRWRWIGVSRGIGVAGS
jgi:MFS family permease